jgi:hypothetical protein
VDELVQITQGESVGEPLVAFAKHLEEGGGETSVELVGRGTCGVIESGRRK